MGFAQGLVLALLGVLFAAWGVLAFRILLRLAARAREASDGVPGPSTQLAVWNGWLRDPADRRARRGFLAVSVALFAAIALAVWVMAPAAG
ncbi:hypothetical protein ATO2_06735 [Roseovarius sp. 22II1-1F6A]|nr:hypothetical protein ATO2_06735 [Roseovarius sp. 22II1-1F6A]